MQFKDQHIFDYEFTSKTVVLDSYNETVELTKEELEQMIQIIEDRGE